MELYDTMVNLMPAECTSVSYVLHCMLEQVLMFQAPRNPSPSPGQSVSEIFVLSNEQSGIDAKKYLESQLDLLDIHYGLSKCEVFDYEISDPKVLLHGDIQLQLTRQVQIPEINIAEITMDLLKWYPFIKLWEQCVFISS
ncbi:hypothetical protein C0J52_18058 [Blattella germanica]|nr:hypothetical protein C0J52_18058 [Blattella germanica]